MFCYSKGIEKAVTEFWSEHGYFMGRQWGRQLCDLMFATTCKHHTNRVLKCVHVALFKLVALWIDKMKVL